MSAKQSNLPARIIGKLRSHAEFRRLQSVEAFWLLLSPVLSKRDDTTCVSVDFAGIDGLCNPSITSAADACLIAARCSTYVLNRDGSYSFRGGVHKLDSETYLTSYDRDSELGPPVRIDDGAARIACGIAENGFEDPRIFKLRGRLFGLWSAMTLGPQPAQEGQTKPPLIRDSIRPNWTNTTNVMVLGTIDEFRISDIVVLPSPHGRRREKNWAPIVDGDTLYLVYSLETMEVYRIADDGLELARRAANPKKCLSGWSGSSQFVRWENGWLCVAHFAGRRIKRSFKRATSFYFHRFVFISRAWEVTAVSRPFIFKQRGIEFCAGLTINGDRLLASFGVADREGYILEMPMQAVSRLLKAI